MMGSCECVLGLEADILDAGELDLPNVFSTPIYKSRLEGCEDSWADQVSEA